ncbi:hypothetical protein Q0Z83_056760 [Actinoplanes sichuanensis]|uniref:TetR/AcrR family transcriptional regulator n=1 Tax=Actinoplanes sichuanensis TaxID=512349 RepID=A0ABW4A712_9ACTN|nr:TetR/AcrR family transcriptional regulator [Actinoplanes sichuanensis]BEL07485.1 hypothetical protein Q0Z83_056760 [Actinoplanes sichuanensis]
MGRVSQAQAAENRERIVATAARLFREHGIAGVSVADVTAEAGLTHGGFYKHFASKDALVAEAVTRAFADQAATLRPPTGAPDSAPAANPVHALGSAPAANPVHALGLAPAANPAHAADSTHAPDLAPAAGSAHAPDSATGPRSAGDVNGEFPANQAEGPTPGDADQRRALISAYLSAAHRDDPGSGCPSAGFGGDVARATGGDATRAAYAAGVEGFARFLGSGQEPDLAALSTMVGALILSRATAGTELSDRILAAAHESLTKPTVP